MDTVSVNTCGHTRVCKINVFLPKYDMYGNMLN